MLPRTHRNPLPVSNHSPVASPRRPALASARRLALIPLLALAALAPACLYEKIEDRECPPEGTALTFENFGKPFLDTHCNYCHGSAVLDRQSAPPAYVFETPQQVERWADRIYVRAAGPNTTMPPGPDDPPESEREKLAEWLACTYGD
jgi:uncharacterized membrane protein